MKTFKITEIVGWHEDSYLMDGDASHEGYAAVQELLVEERRSKETFDPEKCGIIPFVCKANDIDEAIEKLNERFFEYDYLKVWDVDYEII